MIGRRDVESDVPPPTSAGRVWVPRSALLDMIRQADRHTPRETGGVLLGYWSAAGDAAVVEHVVGPGPDAVHRPDSFVPDHAYQDLEIGRLYRLAGGALDYLGDWHTHPGGVAALSRTDLATLRRIAWHRAARAPRPVMLLLAGGEPWQPAAWVGEVIVRRWWRDDVVARPLLLEIE